MPRMGTAGSRRRGGPQDPALRILAQRLARGDISTEEYTSRRAVLMAARPPAASRRRPGRRLAVAAAAVIAAAALAATLTAALAAGRGPGYAPWAASRPPAPRPPCPGRSWT
jgi:hypothetical protein